MHLMRWQQLFSQIFLCSYPFPVHLKSIFVAGASWKVVQGKTKLTLLTYVRFEEDDPLGPTPLDIYLLYYLLRGLFSCFLLLRRIVIKKWDFKLDAKAQVLAPIIAPQNSNFSLSSEEKKYNFDVYPQLHLRPQGYLNPGTRKGHFRHFTRVSDAWELAQHH